MHLYSHEAEQAVLACFIRYKTCYLLNSHLIQESDFFAEAHQHIFSKLERYFAVKCNPDLVELVESLVSSGVDASYLSGILNASCAEANVELYIKIIREKSIRRNMVEAANEISTVAANNEITIDDVCATAESLVFNASPIAGTNTPKKVGSLIADFYNEIDEIKTNRGRLPGVKTGFYELDMITQGFRKESLVVLAGRPGMGKTSFALNILENLVLNQDKTVCIYSLEMSASELLKRIISSNTSIDQRKMASLDLSEMEISMISSAAGKLTSKEDQIIIDDSPDLTPIKLRAKLRRQCLLSKPDLIIVDYLQLMDTDNKKSNTVDQITEISRELKKIAKEFKTPVLALSQLNRGIENRAAPQQIPQLSDLRGSGSIEQDADLVIFVHREEKINRDSDRIGLADIYVVKNRHGETGNAVLSFIPQTTRFENREAIPHEYFN